MILKVLILLFIFFSLGRSQGMLNPEVTYTKRFLNLEPSVVHSIRGKFYEEKQTKKFPKSETNTEVLSTSENLRYIAKKLQDEIVDESITTHSKYAEKIPSHQNKDNGRKHNLKIRQPSVNELGFRSNTSETTRNSNSLPQVHNVNKTETIPINGQNISMKIPAKIHFQAEKVVSNYDKNDTIETVMKELAFDSLLIQNHFKTNDLEDPRNITNSYIDKEINPEADIFLNNKEDSRRWFVPNEHYPTIPPPVFEAPKMLDNNVILNTPKFEHTNYANLPKNVDPESIVPTKQQDKGMFKNPCEETESSEISDRTSDDIQLKEPTKGAGISNVVKSRMMLLNHPRVCYACSSITDPSCWTPDRSTSVKYCRTDHPSCLTKLYKFKGLSYIMRDCGNVCEQAAPSEGPKYSACTICHHDLCNGAYNNKITITFLLLHLLFVFTLYDKIL